MTSADKAERPPLPPARLFHAQAYLRQNGGVERTASAPDGKSISARRAGAWAEYPPVDFGRGEYAVCMAFASSAGSGARIELRLDSPDGKCISRMELAPSNGIFQESYAKLSRAQGMHPLFLVFPGEPAEVDWFALSAFTGKETTAQRNRRMRWWRESRFGMFIHWGPYAVPARGEWSMYLEQRSNAAYEQEASSQFDPQRFDAHEWVRLALEAGQRYLVLTAKHHDGFCLFPTRARGIVSQLDSARTYSLAGYGRALADPAAALRDACRETGIRFGLYYSILDWHHDSQTPVYDGSGLTWMKPGRRAEYVSLMKEQLRELIEWYDPDLLWFDGDWGGADWWWTAADGAALYRFLRTLKPDLVINERVKRDSGLGDFRTPEQFIPPTGLPYDWETCMTMNTNWGYHAGDQDWKPAAALIRNLAETASKGGNFLLNIGPNADGTFPAESVERLQAIGAWMRAHGDSIHGSLANPFTETPTWGCFTRKAGRLYAHLFDPPPSGCLLLPPGNIAFKKARILAQPDIRVEVCKGKNGWNIQLPQIELDAANTVLVLETSPKKKLRRSAQQAGTKHAPARAGSAVKRSTPHAREKTHSKAKPQKSSAR